ncbi:M3 family metallopeptidase [Pseudomarimonas arenosa]|uniref:oligopeptidase A n=1 Tax=Pseudomarimonas arenosa TaxID=2774145 RepID=A0AAW3ZNU3_9GAMM|nr:M3 family metallopeptidase [Pseudomarimonas arenosa]MBD8527638.1 M3 family metallopeptidase [Pseudomarimonas arenosa]
MNTETNPLLSASELPAFSAIQPAHVLPAVRARIEQAQLGVEQLLRDQTEPDFHRLIAPLERLEEAIGRSWSPVSHLHGVRDSAELRAVYAEADELLTEFNTELGQNRALYEAVKSIHDAAGFAELGRAERTLVEDSLRGFRLSGVALEGEARQRFKQIQTELSRLSTEFEEAVLDCTDAWGRALVEDELAGLPASARQMLAQMAKEKGESGYRATLKGPVVQALLTYADSRNLREEVYSAYNTRASELGPHDHARDNGPRIEQIVKLRHEAAQLLGFNNAAELSLADKMAGKPERVLAFLHDLAARARPQAERELAELQAFAAETLGLADLQPWDIAYASEKRRQALFDFSEEDLKPYFPLPGVLNGLFAIAGQVLGVKFRPRQGVDVWHPDVAYFDVLHHDDEVIAGFYVDHYARSGKRGGAWMDVCRSRFRDGALQRPVAYLTCNFPPPNGDQPALLTHDDVLTLFHEFGHGLHHMLSEIDWPSVSGISGVEWDAVELPSQFLENFCWQRETLDLFARHWQSGETLPDALFQKMLEARHFHAGMFLVRQLEFALFDFRLHLEYDPARGARARQLLEEVRAEVAVIKPPAWHRFANNFTHIFAGGYAAGYYSYLWAEVLSADAFAAFEEAGLFDYNTGQRYRREILAVGGSRPALESFIAFRGREPLPDALLKSYGLAA